MSKVDLSAYAGREQAYVKHCLLEQYLPDWGYKIGSAWDNLVYVDGFAGPWGVTTGDMVDSSFGVAIRALRNMRNGMEEARGRRINIRSILVERKPSAFERLNAFATKNTAPGFRVHAIGGRFTDKIDEINNLISQDSGNTFKFVFLDPKGWKDIPMTVLVPFLKNRSCEVLINLMARHAVRFLEQNSRKGSYDDLFGRKEVLDIVKNAPKNQKLNVILQEYCASLRLLCGFHYVSAAAILEPNEEAIRYFLVFGTNHLRGIEVFKRAERAAARIQDKVRFETIFAKKMQCELSLFLNSPPKTRIVYALRDDYISQAMTRVIQELLKQSDNVGLPFSDIYARAMELPLVAPEDLIEGIRSLPCLKMILQGERRRVPSVEKGSDDRVVVVKRKDLELHLQNLRRHCHVDEVSNGCDLGFYGL